MRASNALYLLGNKEGLFRKYDQAERGGHDSVDDDDTWYARGSGARSDGGSISSASSASTHFGSGSGSGSATPKRSTTPLINKITNSNSRQSPRQSNTVETDSVNPNEQVTVAQPRCVS